MQRPFWDESMHPTGIGNCKTKRRRVQIGVGVLFIIALGLRCSGARWGLPMIWHPDTHQYVATAWVMSGEDLNPRDVIGVLTNFPFYVHLVMGLKCITRFWYSTFGTAEGLQAFADGGGLVLATRLMSAVFRALSVLAAYRIGAVGFGRTVGLVSAALLSLNYFSVRNAHSAMPDVAMIFFLLMAMERSATYLRSGARVHLWLAAVAGGVATATKITGGVALLCPLVAVLLRQGVREWRSSLRLCLGAVLVFGATILVLCPLLVSDGRYLGDIYEEVFNQASHRDNPQEPLPVWLLHHKYYAWGLGWAAYALSAMGVAAMFWRRPKWATALLAAPGVYLAIHLGKEMCFPRYTLPPVPFMLIAGAWGACWLARRCRARRRVLAGLVVLACADPFARAVRFDWLCHQEDTRYQAKRWVEAHVPRYACVLLEGLMPPIPTHPYCVYARGQSQRFLVFVRPNYFVSSMQVRRFLAFNERYRDAVLRGYAMLDRSFQVVAEFKPFEGNRALPYSETIMSLWRRQRPGPHIKVYKISTPTPRPIDMPVLLQPPLGRADWLYLARIGCFPIGMLTQDLASVADAVAVARAELARLGILAP